MNKTLFKKVKDLCKDTGLSEKYLTAITEKMGGSIEDDSTDEAAIEEVANHIADVAKESQGEATRWANKAKEQMEPKEPKEPKDPKDPKEPKDGKDPKESDKRISELQEEMDKMKQEQAKKEREASVKAALDKHGIPEWRRKGLVIPEEEDPDTYCAGLKQDLITQNLIPEDPESVKSASVKNVDEASDALLESITVK